MSNSHRLALIAAPKVFSYLLSLGPNYDKRPRGLDILLGHLLDERILVWYKLITVVAVQISLKIQVKSRYMYSECVSVIKV